jgi:peptide/nickel transport system substrate-binding protein
MSVRRRWRGAGMCVLAAVVLAASTACSSSDASSQTSPTRGGALVIARGEENKTLDPAAAVSPADIAPINEIFDRLYALGPDGKSIVPSLAESSTTSADGKTWTFTLRSGATFSTGAPVTAQDVKYSLDRSRKSDGAFAFLLSPIASVRVVDPKTVEITTAGPSATLLPALSSWVASILPANLGGKSAEQFFAAPVGSGPFTFDQWVRGQYISLKRNTTYWRSGQPLLDSVRWNTVPDANTRVSQVQAGQASVAADIPFSQVDSLKNAGDVTANSFPANLTTVMVFNQSYAPFADVHVRRAIAYTLDRAAITKSALFGSGEAACSLVPPTMPYSANDNCLPLDPSAAKAELAKSKYAGGFPVELTIDNQPASSTVAQIVQSELAALGITVTIKVVDSGQLYTTLGQRAYQMGYAAWASDIPDPDEQLTFMLDPKAGGDSYYTGYDNPAVTKLINEARVELDSTKRAAQYAEVQRIVAQEVPQLPLSNQANPYLWRTTVQNFHVSPMGIIDLAAVGMSG